MAHAAANFGVRNTKVFFKALEKEFSGHKKAAGVAVRVEGYRLMRVLKSEIREGAPGGKKMRQLSVIASYLKRPYRRAPYRRIATAVRYDARQSSSGIRFVFGFISSKSSKSWVKIAKRAQSGATFPITDRRKAALRKEGARLAKKPGTEGDAKYFFIRRTTKTAKTPPRQIISPFWQRHRQEAVRNIHANFRRKMKGERI